MTILLNTLFSEKGELFAIGQGRMVVFAHCKPKISIYEKSTQVSVLGEHGYKEKSIRFTIVLYRDMEFTSSLVEETMQKAEQYELAADLMRDDGIVERFYFHNISFVEIDPEGRWEFDLNVTGEQMRKLLEMANI